MRRLKIGIRPQLIIIVCFASLFSLLILGIVTGIYFSANLKNLRLERLLVISQLKRTQVQQAIQYIAYQVMTVSEVDSLTVPLSNYRAGNNSKAVFLEAQNYLQQYVLTTDSFTAARLYDLDLQVVASSFDNMTLISESAQDVVYPLQPNRSMPPVLGTPLGLYFTGPIANNSDNFNSRYFMGITVPVLSNSSIILLQPSISGYLTIVAAAESIRSALNSTSEDDYQALAVQPVYGDPQKGIDNLLQNAYNGDNEVIGFKLVFPVENSLLEAGTIYNINSSSSMKTALASNSGTATGVKSFFGKKVAIGFSRISVQDNLNWSIVIVQSNSVFNGPANKLRKITIGVVIGIGAFMCFVTFPLAVWFIRPITKLKEATEAITKYKKEKLNSVNSNSPTSGSGSGSGFGSRANSDSSADQSLLLDTGKRNSINSSSFSSSYSTGIRLPARIPRSKKIFKDELTELSEAFNIMTEELDKQYTHLEDRVKLRTKELEASKIQAEAANEAKTVFIANISHELRTPLNGILGMTSIAMEEEDPNVIHDSLKLIHRSGELLLHILTELLTYSKNTLNRSKLEKSNFQILEIVYQVRSIFNKLAHDQRVNFKILVKPNIFRKLIIYGDSNRIIQIVMNLVSNSLKFTPVDGSVSVSFKLLGEYDHERSKKLDYKKVCILNDSSSSTVAVPPPTPPSDTKPNPKPKSTPTPKPDPTRLHLVDHNNRLANTTSPLTPVRKPTNQTKNKSITNNVTKQNMKIRKKKKTNKNLHNNNNNNKNDNSDFLMNRRLSGSHKFNNTNDEELSPTAIEKNIDKYLTSSADSDNISVTTLSTVQYETTIFESQFKSKPLPALPVDAKPQVSGKIDENDVNDEDPSGGSIKDDDSEDTINEKQGILSSPSSSSSNEKQENLPRSNDSTTVTVTRPRHNMMPLAQDFKSYPTFDKKPEYDSNMSNNEIVKNNRVYRIRNMYQPKVWVIQIEVTDTGPGIEPALQEKVFEPFVQGDQTLSRSYGGTGLGLSICRQLATMMHGTLTLKSTIGKGSTFTLTLPLPQTGEIMVPPEDMAEFCEDEFNPAAKINRKVAFEDGDIDTESQQQENPSSEEDTQGDRNVQSSTSSSPPNSSSTDSALPASDSSDIGGTNKSKTTSHGNNKNINAKKRIITNSSASSTKGTKRHTNNDGGGGVNGNHSDDNKDLTLTIDKPLLFTRGSTGTANSGTTSSHSDKKILYPTPTTTTTTTTTTDHTTVLDDISHLRVLVAEDNLVNQEVISRMLKQEGITNLTMACNGAKAIDFVKESIENNENFDLIFMDVQMPEVDGLKATKMIRKNLQYNKPIIALTAFADESNVKECLNSGMSGFITKPISKTNIKKVLVEFLSNEVVTS